MHRTTQATYIGFARGRLAGCFFAARLAGRGAAAIRMEGYPSSLWASAKRLTATQPRRALAAASAPAGGWASAISPYFYSADTRR